MFAALHTAPGPFLLPNAWDVASALLLADAGFPAIGTTSLGVTAAAGLPDGAGAGRDLTVALTAALVARLPVPLTVDLEGGYADDPAEVADLAVQLADLGVAGINLEDGRPNGQLRPAVERAAIIRAVAAAAPDLFINARTDTYWLRTDTDHDRLPETLQRLAAYRDAGAARAFTPGLSDRTAIQTVAATIGLPLNVLWQPGVSLADLGAAGSPESAPAQRSTGTPSPPPLMPQPLPAPPPRPPPAPSTTSSCNDTCAHRPLNTATGSRSATGIHRGGT